mgnify:CR=1 FL=1
MINNFIFKYMSSTDDKNPEITDIDLMSNRKVAYCNSFLFNIDFSEINLSNYDIIIKNLKRLKKKKRFSSIGLKENNTIILAYVFNYNHSQIQTDFLNAIVVIALDNKTDKLNYLYDTVCNFLDNEFSSKNLCGFTNNKCYEKINSSSNVGCCRHYKHKLLGPLLPHNPLITCEYLQNYKCSAKCISCKLFTCDFLRKQGIRFDINKIFLLRHFCNSIQKYIIKTSVFTPKDKIIKKLLFFQKNN